jgi:hypothetical protein
VSLRTKQAEDHLAKGAVHRRDELVGERVGNEKDRAAGPQVVVLGERAVEVRKVARPARPLDLGGTVRGLVVEAHVAPAARIEVGVGDTVPFFERPTERIGLHPRAELGDPTGHLVPENPAVLGQAKRRVASPEVEVRAADVGERDAHQDGVRLDLRQRHVAEVERFSRSEEDGGFSGAQKALL